MKIAMGNDHSAVEMKEAMKAYVESKGYEVIDFGTNSTESCDYPEFGEKVGRAVASGEADYGIAICGTGIGIGIATGKAAEAISRQPEAESKISKNLLLGAALAEGTAIFGFVVALLIILFLG